MGYYREQWISSLPALFMPRRPAVLLTSPRHTSDSSLLPALPALSVEGSRERCTLCTALQKSEAHLLPLQSLPASLQKPRVYHRQRSFNSPTLNSSTSSRALSSLFFTLLHQTESHPLTFQSLAHSLCVYPGCHPERSQFRPIQLPTCKPSNLPTCKRTRATDHAPRTTRPRPQEVGLSGTGCEAMKSSRKRNAYESSNSWTRSACGDFTMNPAW